MSSRYPSNDSRYTSRDRTPPRYTDRRPSAAHGSSFVHRNDDVTSSRTYPDSISGSASRDVPRGPKALADSARGPPPGGGSSVPAGPRGRGFGARSEYRELRDAPPLSDGRGGSSWRGSDRDRHFDRRDRAISPRARSPGRDSRDSRDSRDFPPRELDIDRARKSGRDGPPSAGSSYSDSPSSQFGFYGGRGGFGGRGRGRGDWDDRGRGRGSFVDRNSFRPRSRSPRPRWEKDSRDDRISDRRDDRRFDRRDDDRPFYRDDREREVDRYKRDPGPRDADIRRASVVTDGRYGPTPSSTTHHSPRHSSISMGHANNSAPDLTRDLLPSRRTSVAQEPISAKTHSDKPEYIAARAEASRDRYGPRASSPPPSAPQVPAFGSVASFQKPATTFSTPTSNVWRPPPQPPTPSAAPAPSKIPTSAPKAPSSIPPTAPTGPKASRPLEKPVEKPVETPASSPAKELAKSRIETPPAPSSQPPSAPRVASTEPHDAPSRSRPPSPPAAPPTGPAALQPRLPTTVPPTGPRGLVSPQQPHSRLVPPLGPPRDVAPPNIPLGPRATVPFSTPPRGPSAGPGPPPGPAIPTGPKADRAPPAGPRAALGPNSVRPPMMGVPGRNLQWIRPDAPRYGRPGPVVPAKRDFEGDEKEKGSSSRPRSPAFPMGSPVSGPATPSPAIAAEPIAQRRRSAGEIRSRDEPSSLIARRNSAFASSDPPVKREDSPPPSLPKHESESDEASEDDDEMDLDDEDFFGQSKITYEREKTRLEARLKKLEDASLRFTVPLRSLLRLSRVADAHIPQPEQVLAPEPTPVVEIAEEHEKVEQPAVAEEKPEDPDVPMEDEKEDKASSVVETPAAPEPEPEPSKLLTPKADEHEDVEMPDMVLHRVEEDVEDEASSTSEDSITEAQLQSLPYLHRGPPTPLSDPDQEVIGLKPSILASIKGKLMDAYQAEREFQDSALQTFRVVYKEWGLETAQREKELAAREEKEKTEEQETAVSPTEPAPGNQPTIRQRHVTDYDLENIMKESMRLEEERKEKQRREEEAKNPFSGGQAPIPDMLPEEELRRAKFINTNRLREPGKGIVTFGFEPPDDDFTPEEHKSLVVAYHQTPKDWGEIAKALPGRDFRECIAHYYSTKWNGEYKPPTGRRKAKRKAPANPRKTKPPFASTEKDDVAGEDGAPASTTERGRPRRAAAPTFGDKEVQEQEHATPTPTPGRQRGTSTRGETVEPTTEKPTKRQRATKEKGNKKSRTQNLAPAPSASPQKMDRDIKDMYQAEVPGDLSHLPRTSEDPGMLPAPSQLEIPHLGPDAPMLHPSGAPEPVERPRARTANSRAGGMSSYWSVNETTDFRNYLSYFGTDFAAIARQMGTKTPAMVKNEFTRKTDTGKGHDLVEIAHTADERRKRGEDMGPPPPPTASTKRRDYTSQPPVPRTLAPTPSDAIDDSRSPTKQPEVPPQTSSPHPQAIPRFPPLAQAVTPMSTAAMSTAAIQPAVSGPTATQAPAHPHSYGRPQHDVRGPARGYFSQREPTRPPLIQPEVRQQTSEPMREIHPEHHQVPFGQGMPQPMQDQRYPRLAVDHREREVMPEPVTSALHPQGGYRAGSQHLARDPRSDPPTPNTEPRPPVHLTAIPRQPAQLRHLVETPSQLPVAQGQPHHTSRPPSPKREEAQPPFVSQAPTPVQALPRPVEPPRRSNLADLLNPTSSEPSKPKEQKVGERPSVVPQERPFSAQGRPIRQTGPPPQPTAIASGSPAYHRGELFAESPKPGSPFARPAYVQPPAQQISVPPSSRRNMEPVREQSQPPPARDWARPSFSQPPSSSSPHPGAMQPQPALTIDTRPQQFPGNHRAALSQLNGQQRNIHSPTPSHTPVAHSRTPSYSHAQPARQQAPTPIPHGVPAAPSPAREIPPGPVLQSNPYAQMTPPQNIQQPAPPLAQQIGRNDPHSRTLSYTRADERAYDSVRGRDRALMEQERREYEFVREREREAQAQSFAQARAAQAQAEAQRHEAIVHQHYMRQPTPTQADPAAARYPSAGPGGTQGPSRGSAHTPTGHMGYPPPPAPPGGPQLGLPPPGSQQDRHAPPHHSFPSPFPSAAQRGFEAMTRAEEAQYLRQQEAQHVQHAQVHAAHAQAQAQAQAHADQRYREGVAAAQAAHQHAQQAQAQAVQQQQVQQQQVQQQQQAAAVHAAAAEQDLNLRRNHAHAAHAAAAHHHSQQQQQQQPLSEAMAEKERRDRDHRDREHHHRARQSQVQADYHMSAARAQQQQQQQQVQAHQQQHAAQQADIIEWQRRRDLDRDVFGGRDGRSGLFGPGPRKA
ncbi:uncharacterized protein IWZ02DRAFT_86308 [Phyllosticta citriasiana]|uniref:uncharacterized protein n=1 Tax=Phyllosticta citriasiana TaxID=595635 RepID=UPI0030FD2B3C